MSWSRHLAKLSEEPVPWRWPDRPRRRSGYHVDVDESSKRRGTNGNDDLPRQLSVPELYEALRRTRLKAAFWPVDGAGTFVS